MKRILSMLLALAMLASMTTFVVFADEAQQTSPLGQVVTLPNTTQEEIPENGVEVWSGNVEFEQSAKGLTFVLRFTGVEKPISATKINLSVTEENGKTFTWDTTDGAWEWTHTWGKTPIFAPEMTVSKDGIYYLYLNQKVLRDNNALDIKSVQSLSIFVNKGDMQGRSRTNENENATVQLLKVVPLDLQPTATFHGEDGVIATQQIKYTDNGNKSVDAQTDKTDGINGNAAKQFNLTATPDELFQQTEQPEPEKDGAEFLGWTNTQGGSTLVSGVYEDCDLYPVFLENDGIPEGTHITMFDEPISTAFGEKKNLLPEEGYTAKTDTAKGFALILKVEGVSEDTVIGQFNPSVTLTTSEGARTPIWIGNWVNDSYETNSYKLQGDGIYFYWFPFKSVNDNWSNVHTTAGESKLNYFNIFDKAGALGNNRAGEVVANSNQTVTCLGIIEGSLDAYNVFAYDKQQDTYVGAHQNAKIDALSASNYAQWKKYLTLEELFGADFAADEGERISGWVDRDEQPVEGLGIGVKKVKPTYEVIPKGPAYEDEDVGVEADDNITARTDGVNQGWQTVAAGTALTVLNRNGEGSLDTAKTEKPDGIFSDNRVTTMFDERPGSVWMRANNTWLFGYAVEISGLSGPTTVSVKVSAWQHDAVTANGRGWPYDCTVQYNIPGDGTYFLAISGQALYSTNESQGDRPFIGWASDFAVTLGADAQVRVLAEVEATADPEDQEGTTFTANLPVKYVNKDGEDRVRAVDLAGVYDRNSRPTAQTYDAGAGIVIPKFADIKLKDYEENGITHQHIGWSSDEVAAETDLNDVCVIGGSGIYEGTAYPVYFAIPAGVDELNPQKGYNEVVMEPVKLNSAEADAHPAQQTVWTGSVELKKTSETGAAGVTFVYKVDGVNTPIVGNNFDLRWNGNQWFGTGNYFYNNDWGGAPSARKVTFEKSGYYFTHIGSRVISGGGATPITSVEEYVFFKSNEGANTNPDATFEMLAVVENNLAPTVNFYGPDGKLLTTVTHQYFNGYTNVSTSNQDGTRASKQAGEIYSANEFFALQSDVAAPTKEADENYQYELVWVDADRNPVEAVYKSQNLYAYFRPIDLSKGQVIFTDEAGSVLQSEFLDAGSNPTFKGDIPKKAEDADNTYVFKGWSIDGEQTVDLTTYQVVGGTTVTFKPLYVAVAKIKATASGAPVFNGTEQEITIKLSQTEIVTDALAGETIPITGGTLTVKYDTLGFKGEGTATVEFDSIQEDGTVDGVLTLDSAENVAGGFTFTVEGTVTGEGDASATVYASDSQIEITGQQTGAYFDNEPVAINKDEGETKPASQSLWSGNVSTAVDGKGADGVTFVYRLQGIETQIVADNFDVVFNTSTHGYADWNWQNGGNCGGLVTAGLTFEADGYYYMYLNKTPNGGDDYKTVNNFQIFTNPNAFGGPNRTNTNENATFQMLAIVANNLAPTVTFYADEEGQEEIVAQTKQYTNLNGTLWSQSVRTIGNLVTVAELFEESEEQAPSKVDPDGHYTYTFTGWVDAEGNAVDENAVYMNMAVYAHFDKTITDPVTVTFSIDGDESETVEIPRGTAPTYDGVPTKDSTDTKSYIFSGWTTDPDKTIATTHENAVEWGKELSEIIAENDITVYAVFEEVDRIWKVTLYDDDHETELGIVYVRAGQLIDEKGDPTEAPVPTKTGDAQYTYTFEGWVDENGYAVTLTDLLADTSVYASYTTAINQYTVTFYDEDKETKLGDSTVDYDTPAVRPTTPTKEQTDEFTYTFEKWVDENGDDVDLDHVKADINVYAKYTSTVRKYTVTFYGADGNVIDTQEVEYGKTATLPADPEGWIDDMKHVFDKWVVKGTSEEFTAETVIKDTVDVEAVFTAEELPSIFKVTFMVDDKVYAEVEVEAGKAVEMPADPSKDATDKAVYVFAGWTDKDGKAVDLSAVTQDVTVYASFTEKEIPVFADVPEGKFYTEAVNYITALGLMNGVGGDKFNPNGVCNRAMLVTVLYRIENQPDVSDVSNPFTDVKAGAYYENAIKWAYSKGIVTGVTEDEYRPTNPVTREQFASILYRYVTEYKGEKVDVGDTTLDAFPDQADVHSYATEALTWAVSEELITGSLASDGKTYLKPRGDATRAQMATILYRFMTVD